jgi:RHS repeat-associated protein
MTDGIGNVRVLTDGANHVKRTYDYEEWGQLSSASSDPVPLNGADRARFKGALWMGPEAEIYYMRNRWYDSRTGRFLSEDPAGLATGLNPYAFGNDDPINMSDPTGLDYQCKKYGTEYTRTITYPDGTVEQYSWRVWERMDCTEVGRYGGAAGTQTVSHRVCKAETASGLDDLSAGLQSAAGMFLDWLTGSGAEERTFGPTSVESRSLASSSGVTTAVENYLLSGQRSGLFTFGLTGLLGAGINPIRQYVGSFRYTITPTANGFTVNATNTTGVWSASYHELPDHQRSSFGPLGNMRQTYVVGVKCES